MHKRFRHILMLIILFSSALLALGQSVVPDKVCVGTTRKYYVTGLPGSLYTWKIDGVIQGSTSDSIDIVWDIVGSFTLEVQEHQDGCHGEVQSEMIVVNDPVSASVSIVEDKNNICPGTLVLFTATPVNGGTTPRYQWKVNGLDVGTDSIAYAYTPIDGDKVNVEMISSEACVTDTSVVSNEVIMKTVPLLTASVTIAEDKNNICSGTLVLFTATPVNGGATPRYQWKVNGLDVGTDSIAYAYAPLDGDRVTVEMTTSEACVTDTTVVSNEVIMKIVTAQTASVTIAEDSNNICPGTMVLFTATPVNGGTTPRYQWKVNGLDVGTDSIAYSYVPANGDKVTVEMTSNEACVTDTTVVSNEITMAINSLQTASVTIAEDSNNICPGTLVLFTATPLYGGTTPGYQWKVNGIDVGTDSPTYSYAPVNGDKVSVEMASSEACVTDTIVVSNEVVMTIATSETASVTIAEDKNNICPGTLVLFTATPVNGGTNPSFQWKINGVDAGMDSIAYAYAPANGDKVTVEMTSSETCVTDTTVVSNEITMAISSLQTASVTIAEDKNNICPGTLVLFTATPVNGGTTPRYQWKVNGLDVGTDSIAYAYTPLDGDRVTVEMTSNEACLTDSTVVSNEITMTMGSLQSASVTIAEDKNNICPGTIVVFTATTVNGGTSPKYQWKVNGLDVGTDSTAFTYAPAHGDKVTVEMTSNEACLMDTMVVSNEVLMTTVSLQTASVTIVEDKNNICPGTLVLFTATPVNGGTSPKYQWKVNGLDVGTDSIAYAYTPANGDKVTVEMTSSEACLTDTTVVSNEILVTTVALQTASVTIAEDKNNICPGTSVLFTATPINGGTSPKYQWKVNGLDAGTDSLIFAYTPADGDSVTVEMTSSEACLVDTIVVSNEITMTMGSLQTASVSIVEDKNNIFPGTSVLFTATPVNGGTSPKYQWKVNGLDVGTGSTTYSYAPLDGDKVTVEMTSSEDCLVDTIVVSNEITMTIDNSQTASVTIVSDKNNICQGTLVEFTATPVNGGTSPVYQWKVNGDMVGLNSPTYSYAPADGDRVSVEMTSSETWVLNPTVVSNEITITANGAVVASVSIVEDKNNICQGELVLFKANYVNAGTTPIFFWKVNGEDVGMNSQFYSYTPANGDKITVELLSSEACVEQASVFSNEISMVISNSLNASVTIVEDKNNICQGALVNYTATPVNGGTTPVYQWKVNGDLVGTDSPFYSYNPVNGDRITVEMLSNETCIKEANVVSNEIVMTVGSLQTASVSIAEDKNDICQGVLVLFTATPVNGGTNPRFQWKVNGIDVGTDSPTYSYAPEDGDRVMVEMISGEACVTHASVVSNEISMIITRLQTPSVTIVEDKNNICPGTLVLFTATHESGGTAPVLQWKVNGVAVGTDSPTFTYAPADGDQVTVEMTSSETCVSANVVISNLVTMIVDPLVVSETHVDIDADNTLGSIDLAVSGGSGQGTYLFSWSNGSTTEDLGGLVSGDYLVNVTDANGCQARLQVKIKSNVFEIDCPPTSIYIERLSDLPEPIQSYSEWILWGGTAVVSELCSPVQKVQLVNTSILPGNCTSVIRTYRLTDNCGNEATCLQVFNFVDKVLPVFATVPKDVTLQCPPAIGEYQYNSYDQFVSLGGGLATDNCELDYSSFKMTEIPPQGKCPLVIQRTYEIADKQGNWAVPFVHTITVSDTVKPVISCPSEKHYASAAEVPEVFSDGIAGYDNFILSGGTIIDNCSVDSNTFRLVNTTVDDLSSPQVIMREYQIQDLCGNTNQCIQRITYGAIAFAASVNSTGLTCFESGDGKIEISNETGGSGQYQYSINKGITWEDTNVYSNLSAGGYEVIIRDKNDTLTSITYPVVVSQPEQLILNAQVTKQPGCSSSFGEITVEAPLGAGYVYSLDGINYQDSITFVDLNPGTYSLTAKNSSNCISLPAQVIIHPELTVNAPIIQRVIQPDCTTSTGSIELTGLPMTGTWAIVYEGGTMTGTGMNAIVSGLEKGIYHFTVITAEGCTSGSTEAEISSQPITPGLSIIDVKNPDTCGGKGSIHLSLTNVTDGTYTITYDSGSLNDVEVVSGSATIALGAGKYSNLQIIVNGCYSNGEMITLVDPGAPSSPVAGAITQPDCTLAGSIELTGLPTPGIWTVTYEGGTITGTGASTILSGMTQGTWHFTVTTSEGCTSEPTQIEMLSPPGFPVLVVSTITHPSNCGSEGSLVLSLTNVPDGIYTISHTAGSFTAVNVVDGSATITAKAGNYNNLQIMVNGCISALGVDAILIDPAAPVASSITQPDCLTPTGSVELSNLPLTGNWIITFEGGTITGTGENTIVQDLSKGIYHFMVTTPEGCTSGVTEVEIKSQPATPELSVEEINHPSICGGEGSILLSLTNVPDGIYTINHSTGSFTAVQVVSESATITAKAGNYNDLQIIANGCISNGDTVTLIDPIAPLAPLAGIFTQPDCIIPTGSIDLTGLPAEGTWTVTTLPSGVRTSGSGISTRIFGLEPGTYQFTVTNEAGCVSEVSGNVIIDLAPVKPAIIIDQIIHPKTCGMEGTIQLSLENVPDGTYNVTYSSGSFADVVVSAGKAIIPAIGGTYNNLQIKVNGCLSAPGENAILTDPSAPSAPITGIPVHPTCILPTGSVTLTGLPSTGTWTLTRMPEGITTTGTGGSTTISGLLPGTYSFEVTTEAGCISAASANVVINELPVLPVIALDGTISPATCGEKGSIQLSFTGVPDGTYTILYRNGSFSNVVIVSGIATIKAPAGIYSDMQISVNGCTSPLGVSPIINDLLAPPAPIVGEIIMPTCGEASGTVVLSDLPKGNWTINPGNIRGNTSTYTVTGLEANTIYNFTVTNEDGCTSAPAAIAVDTHISAPASPTANVTVQPNCDNPTGTIKVLTPLPSDSLAYVLTGIAPVADPITNATGLFENLAPGASYSIKVMDMATRCVSAEIIKQINALPANPTRPDLTVSVPPSCNNPDGTVMVNRPRGTDYQYSIDNGPYQGSAIFAGLRWGEHTVRVRNVKTGCVSEEVKIEVPAIPPPPVITATEDPAICFGGTGFIMFLVTNVKAGNYTIRHEQGQFEVVIKADGTGKVVAPVGKYKNLVMEVDGCSSDNPDKVVNVEVTQPDDMVITESITPINLATNEKASIALHVTGGNGNYTYSWDNGGTGTDLANLDAGNYTVKVTDENGCIKEKTIEVPLPTVPHAFDDRFTARCNIISGNVILNDIDQENDQLSIAETSVLYPKHGTLILSADGTFEYHADLYYTGLDSFKYALFDKNKYPGIYGTVILELLPDKDRDGVTDSEDKDIDGDGIINELDRSTDVDGDGLPNYMDIDSDGDGIPDQVEAQGTANYIKPAFLDVNNNGVDDAYDNFQFTRELTPIDTDNDGAPDYLDLDSDNDLVLDFIEGHDANSDGKPDHVALGKDADGDGLDDGYDTYFLECDPMDNIIRSYAAMQDFDGDGMADWRDDNDDNDDFPTKYEDMDGDGDLSNDDFDYDGYPEYLDYGRECDLFIPNAFSPNGDGTHDYYQIYCINHYPNAKIYIFDQLGNKLFERANYGNLDVWKKPEAAWWDGIPDRGRGRGELVPPGTYYYVLDLGNGEVKKSFVFVSY